MAKARVEQKQEFVIAGFRALVAPGPGIAQVWADLNAALKKAATEPLDQQRVGIVFGMNASHQFDYMAGILVDSKEDAQTLGLNAAVIPASSFAVADVVGPVPDSALAGIDYLTKTFMPQNQLKPNGPVFEVYGQGDTFAADYRMQVWMPVAPSVAP